MGNCTTLCTNPDAKDASKVDEHESRTMHGGGKSAEQHHVRNAAMPKINEPTSEKKFEADTTEAYPRNDQHQYEGKGSSDYNYSNNNSQSAKLIQSTIGKN